MDKSSQEIIIKAIGILFLLLGVIAIYNSISQGLPHQIIWLCYIGLILIGIGVLIKSPSLIASQLLILTIPNIIWTIDLIAIIITNQTFLGITDYFLIPGPILAKIVSLQHIFTIPLALFVLNKIKLKKTDFWKFSIAQVTLFFILTRFLTPAELNLNCVFKTCLSFIPKNIPYIIEWFVITIIGVFLTHFILVRLKFLRE